MDITVRRTGRILGAVAALSLILGASAASCNGDTESTEPDSGDASLQILNPAEGDVVTVPFEVSVDSDTPLGPIADEMHHLHVWFGDNQADFGIYESDTLMIVSAPNGGTTLWAQVHTFDHQPAGDPVGVSVMIEGGTDGTGGNVPPDYDY
jgi:hypothetical protein